MSFFPSFLFSSIYLVRRTTKQYVLLFYASLTGNNAQFVTSVCCQEQRRNFNWKEWTQQIMEKVTSQLVATHEGKEKKKTW